jgi:hypothetical protein
MTRRSPGTGLNDRSKVVKGRGRVLNDCGKVVNGRGKLVKGRGTDLSDRGEVVGGRGKLVSALIPRQERGTSRALAPRAAPGIAPPGRPMQPQGSHAGGELRFVGLVPLGSEVPAVQALAARMGALRDRVRWLDGVRARPERRVERTGVAPPRLATDEREGKS